jgi:hypothetical protein
LETELKSEVIFRAACNPNRVFQQGHRIWLLFASSTVHAFGSVSRQRRGGRLTHDEVSTSGVQTSILGTCKCITFFGPLYNFQRSCDCRQLTSIPPIPLYGFMWTQKQFNKACEKSHAVAFVFVTNWIWVVFWSFRVHPTPPPPIWTTLFWSRVIMDYLVLLGISF